MPWQASVLFRFSRMRGTSADRWEIEQEAFCSIEMRIKSPNLSTNHEVTVAS